jgi:Calreticulin family
LVRRPYKLNPAYKGKWVAPLVDNPEYKGAWLPRKIPNPGYFKDDTPVKSLSKIGGVGIELWTMTEDILFDNIYVGHSVEDAQKFAKETFEVKKPLEVSANKKALPEDEAEETVSFKEDPIEYIRSHVLDFVDAAKVDPVAAFKAQPEIGAGIAGALFTLFGMIGALLGLVGSQSKPVVTKVRFLS